MANASEPLKTGAVLGKTAIKRLSKSNKLIDPIDPEERSFQPAAYDLRLGHVILADKYIAWQSAERENSVDLRPGEVATLVSREKLSLPFNINGVIVPRNSWAKRGLLILNAGHIDPGYQGVVTAQAINLAEKPIPLVLGQRYFSAIFTLIADARKDDAYTSSPPSESSYVFDLRVQAAQGPLALIHPSILGAKYITRDELSFELVKRAAILAVSLATLAGAIIGVVAGAEALNII